MAIDLKSEELLTLNQAADFLPKISSTKVHVSTIWRWCRIGLWGNYLEYLNIGMRIFTSVEALQRFFIAITQSSGKTRKTSHIKNRNHLSAQRRKRSIQEANDILTRAGIISLAANQEAVEAYDKLRNMSCLARSHNGNQ